MPALEVGRQIGVAGADSLGQAEDRERARIDGEQGGDGKRHLALLVAREVAKGEAGRPDRQEESGDAVLGVRVGVEEILDRRRSIPRCVEEARSPRNAREATSSRRSPVRAASATSAAAVAAHTSVSQATREQL